MSDYDTRNERVKETLNNAIALAEETAETLREEAAGLQRRADSIRRCVRDGSWWALADLLLEDDVESLCEVEPTDREAFLGDSGGES